MAESHEGPSASYVVTCVQCGVENNVRGLGPRERALCGRCHAILPAPPGDDRLGQVSVKEVADTCPICSRPAPTGKPLCDGRSYHQECYANLLARQESLGNSLNGLSSRRLEHDGAIKRAGSLGQRISVFFGGTPVNVELHKSALEALAGEEKLNRAKLSLVAQQLKQMWDYWPEYPPDWDARRTEALAGVAVCEECGRSSSLHVHHRLRIGKGGTHRQDNLAVLCSDCHGTKHGKSFTGREFRHDERAGAYGQRIEILRRAIAERKTVHFSYQKYDGERSSRSLSPVRFKHIGQSLCIEGRCHLRDDTRSFAVKRMRGVKITDEPRLG